MDYLKKTAEKSGKVLKKVMESDTTKELVRKEKLLAAEMLTESANEDAKAMKKKK